VTKHLFSEKALTEKADNYIPEAVGLFPVSGQVAKTLRDYKAGYRQAQKDDKEDLRAWLIEREDDDKDIVFNELYRLVGAIE